MKQILALLFALFPYLHGQRYTVTYHSCEKEHIVVTDNGNPFEITLFNLRIQDDEGWERTCKLLEQAHTLAIEIDPTTQISEPLSVYLFADDEMIQRTLIRENHAYTLIHNPEYLYEQELWDMEKSETTMAIVDDNTESSSHSNGWLFLLFIFGSWILMISIALYPKYKAVSDDQESSN